MPTSRPCRRDQTSVDTGHSRQPPPLPVDRLSRPQPPAWKPSQHPSEHLRVLGPIQYFPSMVRPVHCRTALQVAMTSTAPPGWPLARRAPRSGTWRPDAASVVAARWYPTGRRATEVETCRTTLSQARNCQETDCCRGCCCYCNTDDIRR